MFCLHGLLVKFLPVWFLSSRIEVTSLSSQLTDSSLAAFGLGFTLRADVIDVPALIMNPEM